MSSIWPVSPWVEAHRDHLGFALQVFPKGVGADRSQQLIETGLLAEALGYDAFFIGDQLPEDPSPGCTWPLWRQWHGASASARWSTASITATRLCLLAWLPIWIT